MDRSRHPAERLPSRLHQSVIFDQGSHFRRRNFLITWNESADACRLRAVFTYTGCTEYASMKIEFLASSNTLSDNDNFRGIESAIPKLN